MKIAKYEDFHREAAIGLLSKEKRAGFKEGKEKIWDWQFVENPHVDKFGAGIVVVVEEKILAFNGFMPMRLKFDRQILDALWSCDTIVHPDSRGMGLGGKLTDDVKDRADIVLGLGISDKQYGSMLRRGYVACEEIDQYFFVNRPRGYKDLGKVVLQWFKKFVSGKIRRTSTQIQSSVIDASEITPEFDDLWRLNQDQYKKTVVKDYKYLAWKYGSHPLATYKIIQLKEDGKLIAAGFFRKSNDMSRFLDYVGPASSIEYKSMLLSTFIAECSDSHIFECTTTDVEFKALLKSFGFRRFPTKPRFYIYSNRFKVADLASGWTIMGGDSDNDLGEFRRF